MQKDIGSFPSSIRSHPAEETASASDWSWGGILAQASAVVKDGAVMAGKNALELEAK